MSNSKVIVIVGAGASVGAGLPTAVPLRDLVIERLEQNTDGYGIGSRIANTLRVSHSLLSSSVVNEYFGQINPDLESSIDYLERIARLPKAALSEQWRKIPPYGLNELTSFIKKHVSEILFEASDSNYLAGISELLSIQNPLEVFSLNHDLCVESAFEAARIPYTSGFDNYGKWSPTAFNELRSGIILFKLHGSINWSRNFYQAFPFTIWSRDAILERLSKPCNVWEHSQVTGHARAEYDTPVLFFGGGSKFIMEYPFHDFVQRLSYGLLSSSVVVLIGYGMLDRHVQQLILQSFALGPRTIIQVNPYPPIADQDSVLGNVFLAHSGSRFFSEWDSIEVELNLGRGMRLVTIPERAEEPKTWKVLKQKVQEAIV